MMLTGVWSELYAEPMDETKFMYAQPFTFQKGDYLLNGKNSDIAKLIAKLEAKKERTAKDSFDLGYAYFITDNGKKALAEFERSISMGYVNPKGLNTMAGILLEQGNAEKAEEYYRKTTAKYPDNETALYNTAEIVFKKENLAEARALIKRILDANPKYYDAHQLLGRIAEKENKFDEAEKHFLDEIKQYPSSPMSHRHLAECILHRGGSIDEAIHHFRLALNNTPYDDETRKLLIAAYEKKGGESADIAKAERKLLNSKKADDTLYNYAFYFAGDNASRENLLNAVAVLQEQLKRHPGYLSANLNIGGIYSRLGDEEKAYHFIFEEFKTDQNNASAVFNIALFYMNKAKNGKTPDEQISALAIAKTMFHRSTLIDPMDGDASNYESYIENILSGK